jgi:hypothetical protein
VLRWNLFQLFFVVNFIILLQVQAHVPPRHATDYVGESTRRKPRALGNPWSSGYPTVQFNRSSPSSPLCCLSAPVKTKQTFLQFTCVVGSPPLLVMVCFGGVVVGDVPLAGAKSFLLISRLAAEALCKFSLEYLLSMGRIELYMFDAEIPKSKLGELLVTSPVEDVTSPMDDARASTVKRGDCGSRKTHCDDSSHCFHRNSSWQSMRNRWFYCWVYWVLLSVIFWISISTVCMFFTVEERSIDILNALIDAHYKAPNSNSIRHGKADNLPP